MIDLIRLVEQYTKDDIDRMYKEVYDEFTDYSEDLDFCINAVVEYDVQWMRGGATKALGKCERTGVTYGGGREIEHFVVKINPFLLNNEDTNDKVIKDVIAHELCHTLPGCLNHGKEFHAKAKLIGDLLGYHIDTRADAEASNYFRQSQVSGDAPYKVVCEYCGAEQKYPRLNDKIKKAYQYKCAKCGKPYLIAYKFDKRKGEYKELEDRSFIDAFRELYKIPPLD